MKFKLRPAERKWVLYDVGNSALPLVTTIMPIYFNALAGGQGLSDIDYLAYWGYATSIATLIVAVYGPYWARFRISPVGRGNCFRFRCWWVCWAVCAWA